MKTAPLLVALFLSLAFAKHAAAQTEDPPPPREAVREFLEERAQTRPQIAPPPVGRPPLRNEAANADWDGVRALVANTEQRRVSALTAATAVTTGIQTRLTGLRAVASPPPRLRERELDIVLIPVLVPATQRVLETVEVIGQVNAYTAIANVEDGVELRISGTGKRLVLREPPARKEALERIRAARPPLPGMDAQYVITRSDSSTDLSFSKFKVGYVLSLICDAPQRDPRCAEDAYITELASSMALLNPRRERDE